ncbi:putative photosynthetic complex assembly protein PuhE [Citreimonas sp.]|uniref:putative photosynthetic complex assembly protein PuhE n=1 Tax=Citreimonas sp. TaxID=3036715 RepID=UPI0035C85978
MLSDPWIAALVALFLWWFSTGVILVIVRYSDRRGPLARLMVTLAGLPVFAAGAWGAMTTLDTATPGAAYHAFVSALALWAWVELSFLTGTITGPNTLPCRAGVPEWERFIRAWGTIAYHEIALVSVLVALGLLSWQAPNPFAFLTFAVLFGARILAKLNLFLGVPKINTEFLPAALAHLPSHFRVARGTRFFPVSVAALGGAVAVWLVLIVTAESPFQSVGYALVAAMTALALLEHGFMVLRLPDEKLWRWMLPAPKQTLKKTTTEDAHGL